tara:strand:+ start:794 stop:1048 length:255 start_codon:yes stop_codon:yes gene_type:complete
MSAKGSELKRVRQAKKARIRNKSMISKVNTVSKKVLNTTKKEDALKELNVAVKTIDKIASKKVIHKNKAANKKSSLYKHVNSLN